METVLDLLTALNKELALLILGCSAPGGADFLLGLLSAIVPALLGVPRLAVSELWLFRAIAGPDFARLVERCGVGTCSALLLICELPEDLLGYDAVDDAFSSAFFVGDAW